MLFRSHAKAKLLRRFASGKIVFGDDFLGQAAAHAFGQEDILARQNHARFIRRAGGAISVLAKLARHNAADFAVSAVNQFRVVTALGTFGDNSGLTLQGLQPYLNTFPPYAYVAIGADIDASVTSTWDSGRGFLPLDGGFLQELTGLGHRIDGLHISRTSTPNVGLFSTSYGIIKDLGITPASLLNCKS